MSLLSLLKTTCDENRVTEGDGLLLPKLLKGEAYDLLVSKKDAGDRNAGGLFLYAESVNFLLRNYAH